jgi:hypothetical protein
MSIQGGNRNGTNSLAEEDDAKLALRQNALSRFVAGHAQNNV